MSCKWHKLAETLGHEIAQAFTHDAAAGMARHVHEVIVEAVTSIVCAGFGLDLPLRSADDNDRLPLELAA